MAKPGRKSLKTKGIIAPQVCNVYSRFRLRMAPPARADSGKKETEMSNPLALIIGVGDGLSASLARLFH
ncbi:MAG: hypothetical protein KDJ77_16855, partial [Rhodobiaceae bacterium]|nr:hypothetical protein [Rhodobiaceae bacterium]